MGRLKDITSRFLTLSYPKYRIFVFSLVLLLLRVLPFKLLENSPNLSICSRLFGKYCFSVGITRGVSLLLKGEFSRAVEYNFLAIPILIILVSFIVLDVIKLNKKIVL